MWTSRQWLWHWVCVRIRKDESYEKNYMVGKYGAIPMLKALDIFKDALVQVSEGTGLSPRKKED